MASRNRWIKKSHVTRSCHARSCSQLGGCPGSLKRTVRRSISAGPDYAPTRERHVLRIHSTGNGATPKAVLEGAELRAYLLNLDEYEQMFHKVLRRLRDPRVVDRK